MSTMNEAPPAGAVVLSEAVFEKTSHEWVRLPQLSLKIARLTAAELVAEGWLAPVSAWSETEKRARVKAALAAKEQLSGNDVDDDPRIAGALQRGEVPDAELLEQKAEELRASGVYVEIGMIGMTDVLASIPEMPVAEWPKDTEGRTKAWQEWMQTKTVEERRAFFQGMVDGHLQIVSLGLLTPKLRPEQVRRFGDDIMLISARISRLSGLGADAEDLAQSVPAAKDELAAVEERTPAEA